MSYSMTNWQDSPSTTTPLSAANLLPYNTAINDLDTRVTAKQPGMSVTSTNANISASINQIVLVDTTSGSVTVTLPSGPADGSRICIKQVVRGSSNTVTVQASGLDTFNTSTGGTTSTITLLRQAATYQYYASSHLWITVSDDMPLDQLDARYVRSVTGGDSSVTIGGTASAPTVAVNQAGVSGLVNAYQQGGVWDYNVFGDLMSNMARDDATGTLAMASGSTTMLVLLGLTPAGSYSTFKLYVTAAAASTTITAALFSASSLSSTSWARLGSGNVTPVVTSPGLVSTSLAFSLASPAYVMLQMVRTAGTNFPTFAGAVVPAALINPPSGTPVNGGSSATSAPGSTLNPTTGFANSAAKIWCALA